MLSEAEAAAHIHSCREALLAGNRIAIQFGTAAYRDQLPESGGVYVLWFGEQLVYVGSTTNLRQRLYTNLRDPRNHPVTKTIARRLQEGLTGELPAATAALSPESRAAAREWITANFRVTRLVPRIGRAELEEALIAELNPLFNGQDAAQLPE